MKIIAAVAVAIPLLAADAPMRSVTAVRHWSIADATRVAVEISSDFQFRTDRLHNPERVYFDILDSRPKIENRRLYSEEISDRFLKRVRVAETVPGITRVVLDLADNVEPTTSELINPHRLIIELRAAATPPVISQTQPVVPAAVIPAAVPAPPVERPVTAEPAKVQLASDSVAAPAPVVSRESKVAVAKTADPPAPIAATTAAPAPMPAELAKSAKHTSEGENSLIRALGLKINRVVIDPGHGGHDEGTSGPKGLLEKDLVLDVSQRLGKLIEQHMGAEVIYTRTDDTFVPLEGRTALANEKKADLFLSIHANSSPVPHVAGIETYYLNFTDSKDSLDIAGRENASSEKSIFELRDLIQKITAHDKAEESREFAGRVQASLYAFSARNNPAEKNRGVRKAPFVVLIGASMPSVLAEIGFISNPREEALLKKPDYRQKLAEALYRGVSRYAESLSHFQVAQN
jgi:N-acetylmuramoyl-L-alanine amidase